MAEIAGDWQWVLVGKLRLRDASRDAKVITSHDRRLRPAILIQIFQSIFSALKPPVRIFPSTGSLCFEPLSRTAKG